MNEQLFVTIAVGLIIVLAGYIVQNVNLNARIGEVRADMNGLRGELKDLMQAEFRAIRAELEKNQSELLAKFAELDHRVSRLEQIVRK
jgi:hypothetical protein